MCGRYWLNSPPSELAALFHVDVRDNFPPRYNIAPTQPIALIRQSEMRQREYALARWGFVPEWASKNHIEGMGTRPLINARAETVRDKPSFRNAFKRRRCLIPANGFYEWKQQAGSNQAYAINRSGRALFAFAGIWETAGDPDGGEIDTAAILSIAAGPDMRVLHAREPVVIAPEKYAQWLEGDERDIDELAALLKPGSTENWTHCAVSPQVGNPRNDGPALIERVRMSLFD